MTDLTKSQWKTQNIATLVDQLRHRGVYLTTVQLKGGTDENGKKMKKMTRAEMADMIIEKDNVTK